MSRQLSLRDARASRRRHFLPFEVTGTAPTFRSIEVDQADPAGRFGFRGDADTFRIERATAATQAQGNGGTHLRWDKVASTAIFIHPGASGSGLQLQLVGDPSSVGAGAGASVIDINSKSHATPGQIQFSTGDAALTGTRARMRISGGVDNATITWLNIIQWTINATSTTTPGIIFSASSTGNSNAADRMIDFRRNLDSTPTAGFGMSFPLRLQTSTTVDTLAANMDIIWSTATHASRVASWIFYVEDDFDGVAEEYLRLDGPNKRVQATVQLSLNSLALRDPKNSANTTVSGTVKTVEFDLGGTPYYFLVYPTSSA